MKQKGLGKKLKIVVAIGMVIVVGAGTGIFYTVHAASTSSTSKMVYKETPVTKGNIIAGVTESGSASIGTVTQDFDLDTTSSSSSSTSSTSSSSTGSSSNSGSTTKSASSTASSGSSTASTSSSTSSTESTSSSSTSVPTLEVESVEAKTGQIAAVGNPILKITADSVADYKDYLQQKVTDATQNACIAGSEED